MPRYAAIDIGSNSVRMLTAEVEPGGAEQELAEPLVRRPVEPQIVLHLRQLLGRHLRDLVGRERDIEGVARQDLGRKENVRRQQDERQQREAGSAQDRADHGGIAALTPSRPRRGAPTMPADGKPDSVQPCA